MRKVKIIIIGLSISMALLTSSCQSTHENDDKLHEANNQTQSAVSAKFISFDDVKPKDLELEQSWDSMGIDNNERVYIGWTSKRKDGREDFAIFRYDNNTGEKKFIGTLMDASAKANNLNPDEEIPKGHTKMIYVNGKMYLASQSFHDFKEGIDDLPKYRGSHLYSYDIEKDKLEDISATLPGGVVSKNQGIVSLTYIPEQNMLVGLEHPMSDIVFFSLKYNKIEKIVKGIPWTLGNPLSREIVATSEGKIYTYRGTEDPKYRDNQYNMWEYDIKTDEMKETDNKFSGGFWNGQAKTSDGKKVYLSTVNGELDLLNTESGKVEHLTHFLPEEDLKNGKRISYLYSITLSNDEKKIYGIPSVYGGNVYEYDIASKKVSLVTTLDDGIYTGNNIKDSEGNLYFGNFSASWSGNCRLLILSIK